MNNDLAIVVSAYNRSKPLYRLLQSIATAKYEGESITLIISIDKSDNKEILKIAETFEWKYGEKKVIQHSKHLGLKDHILSCGDLTNQYEAVIILEDDLLVSPYFYEYAIQAYAFYDKEDKVVGISLYNYEVSESSFYPFKAMDDGSDVYFMQVASSWGQLFTKKKWTGFRNWFSNNPELPLNTAIPSYLKLWGKHSWKKHFIHYLIDTDRYFVFPRLALSTNFEEEGTNSSTQNVFQVPLQISSHNYTFNKLEESKSVYDAWFEVMPFVLNHFNSNLSQYEYEVDIYQTKTDYFKEYILTSKQAEAPIKSYSSELFPLENNIALQLIGNNINLYERQANTFTLRNLGLKNHLKEIKTSTDLSLSIIIPVIHPNEVSLKNTLDSIRNQKYIFSEIILVVNQSASYEIEKIVSYYIFPIQVVKSKGTQLEEFILEGLDAAEGEVLSWISEGSIFQADAFWNTNSIFKSFANINWISGIDKDASNSYEYEQSDVFKYRVAPIEIYKRAKKGVVNYSTESHFFRKDCFKTSLVKGFSLKKFYLHLLDRYQLFVVVKCLVLKDNDSTIFNLTGSDLSLLIATYKPVTSFATQKAKLFDLLLRAPFIGHTSCKWYYTALHNFPDVLRYDFKNKTFYLSKH